MTVLIDPPRWPAHGRLWSHLVSDSNLDELHAFAQGAGIPRRGFEGDHYDVPDGHHARLVQLGAVPVESRELLQRLVASGLRIPKRRGEKVLSSQWLDDWLPAGGRQRVDVLLSQLPTPPHACVGAWLLATDHEDRVLLARSPTGRWAPPGVGILDGDSAVDGLGRGSAAWLEVELDGKALVPRGFVRGWLPGATPPDYAYPAPWTYSPVLSPVPGGAQPLHIRSTARPSRGSDMAWFIRDEAAEVMADHLLWPLVQRVLDGSP